jgi:hypothetical protein
MTTVITQSFAETQNSSVTSVNSTQSSDMNRSVTFSGQSSSGSFGYQQSSISVNAANLRQPHILSINTSGTQLAGEITINGKVVKTLNNSKEEINLSPFLSEGEHKVEISARYAPSSSSISVKFDGPGTNVSQQTSGDGVLKATMNVTVR